MLFRSSSSLFFGRGGRGGGERRGIFVAVVVVVVVGHFSSTSFLRAQTHARPALGAFLCFESACRQNRKTPRKRDAQRFSLLFESSACRQNRETPIRRSFSFEALFLLGKNCVTLNITLNSVIRHVFAFAGKRARTTRSSSFEITRARTHTEEIA